MPLPANPFASLVASISASVSKATNDYQATLPQVDSVSKANVDSLVNRLGGGIGSTLNGMTAGAGSLLSNAQGTLSGASAGISGLAGSAQTAMGNIGGVASSIPGASAIAGGVSTLQSTVGSISNATADISGTINKLTGGDLAGGLMGLAGNISKAAGMLNNFLSMTRGANLPAGGESFITQGQAIKLSPGAKNDWRVRIQCQWNIFNSPLFKLLENTGGVVWPYTPNITVSTKANYTQIDPVHSNYPFYGYKNSMVEDIQISGEFSCETETDAAYWIAATTFFKTATKMFFGQGDLAGNPPIICNLTGYGSSVFDKVPVIVKSFSVDLKDDVNYIRCNTFGTNTWVPVLSTVSVTLAPVYNRRRLRKFSLTDYASGKTADSIGYI
jgi:hypothetical protein